MADGWLIFTIPAKPCQERRRSWSWMRTCSVQKLWQSNISIIRGTSPSSKLSFSPSVCIVYYHILPFSMIDQLSSAIIILDSSKVGCIRPEKSRSADWPQQESLPSQYMPGAFACVFIFLHLGPSCEWEQGGCQVQPYLRCLQQLSLKSFFIILCTFHKVYTDCRQCNRIWQIPCKAITSIWYPCFHFLV